MDPKPVHILLIEDDQVDAENIQRAFRRERIANPITVVQDGVEALKVLRKNGDSLEQPYIILLDINMPRMNGLEFLRVLRADPVLRRAIVFVLTTSEREEDKVAAYEGNVAGYIVKNRAGEDFLEVTKMLRSYWRLVEFPPDAEAAAA
ncbi:MAG TPA: response regulator [Rubricoccaceae bacterium]|nr:response regulator [Rubricoccaceae bacterium]